MNDRISICIPTFRQDVQKQIKDIKNTISCKDAEIIASCQSGSSAYNRNYCLDKAKGKIIIMLDDDITGFFPCWDEVLMKPLEDKSVSIVSARLIDENGKPTLMMYNNFRYEPGYYPPKQNVVPAGCIVFRKTGIRFDEKYTGYGYEDTDFCKQMELAHPKKRVVINNNCKLIHPSGVTKMGTPQEKINRKYYHSKWGMVRSPKKPLTTIIYYTGNTEKESFEKKVRENILRASNGIPIISVSQKPIDFGQNICVGEIGLSYENEYKQVLIGCKAAKTDFLIMAESDTLYPKTGYFDFQPKDLNTYYGYDNTYIMWNRVNRTRFYKHFPTVGCLIMGREFYINILKKGLPIFLPKTQKWEFCRGPDPIISIKTRDGVSFGTTILKGAKPIQSFPYWGTVEDVKKNYLL